MRVCYFLIMLMLTPAAFFLACAPTFTVAEHPFVLAEAPSGLPRLPLRVVLLRTPAMQRIPTEYGRDEHFGERLANAAMQGLRDAAALVVTDVAIADQIPAGNIDLLCLPTNPYFEATWDEHQKLHVTITLEITVIEPRTGAQRGLLLQGEGAPGRRPAVPIQLSSNDSGEAWNVGVTGARVHGSRFDEAVNNALFYLSLDFAQKLQKRGAQYLRDLNGEED